VWPDVVFTKLAAVGDALETVFVAALAAQNPPVPVYQGGGQYLTSVPDSDFVIVGHDGSADLLLPAGVEEQEPAGQGDRQRTVRGDLTCAVISQTGDETDMAGRRTRAEALLALLDAPLRTNYTLSGVVQFSWMSATNVVETQNANGCVARYVFTFHYQADI
jgi:hypothetical protein